MSTITRTATVAALGLALVAGRVLAQEAAKAEAAKPKAWDSTLAVGATVNKGNTESTTANVSLTGVREGERHALRLGLEGNYGETEVVSTDAEGRETTETDTTAQNAKGSVNYKLKAGRVYGYSDDSVFHDRIADINYRLIAGLGAGYYLVDSESAKFSTEAGAAYVKEDLRDDGSNDYMALRFAARHDQKLSATAKIWEAVEYLPDSQDFGFYLLNAEAGVEAALNSKLNLRLVAQDRYNSEPPAGRDKNDLSVITALVVKL